MIYFNVNIRNPYWWDRWASIKTWSGGTPFKYKYWEIEIAKVCELFRIEFNWSVREDHAGIGLELGLLGYQIDFKFYDSRHWNIEKNSWEVYDKVE